MPYFYGMNKNPIIIWFRQDLRRADNPALHAAYDQGHPVIPVYILDDDNADKHAMGAASRVWLHYSLKSLKDSLSGHLYFYKGKADEIIPKLLEQTDAAGIYWNRCYESWRIKRDKQIKTDLGEQGYDCRSFNGSLLYEPHETLKDDDTTYKVFTPFYKKGCLQKNGEPACPLPAPERLTYGDEPKDHIEIDTLGLLPDIGWHNKMLSYWTPGEDGAKARLYAFLEDGLNNYKDGRNVPAQNKVSRLSPHLHFGEISPRTVWHEARKRGTAEGLEKDTDHFCSELGWREFSYNLLYHFPDLPEKPLQEKFAKFPWKNSKDHLKAWQKGQTGIPLVDAAMRELWETGYMHNRVRMVVGSFLVKNLLVHWHEGEAWFWDCLFDADLANNSASWQWIAGCGADAAPYFRVFNPVLQSRKFDPKGTYIRTYVPELRSLSDNDIHAPWEAGDDILQKAGIKLGQDYPKPIVDLKESRKLALSAYDEIKGDAA